MNAYSHTILMYNFELILNLQANSILKSIILQNFASSVLLSRNFSGMIYAVLSQINFVGIINPFTVTALLQGKMI